MLIFQKRQGFLIFINSHTQFLSDHYVRCSS